MKGAYMGKILHINLTDKKVWETEVPEDYYRKFIGGRGIAAKLLFDEMKPGVDPLSPENKMVWGTGPLTGLPVQAASSGWLVVTKSPLTNTYFRSRCVSNLGIMLKKCGYDFMIIEGKAEKPTYIYIENGEVDFGDASSIWGTTTDLAQYILKEHILRNPKAETAVIGPAGERLVKYAIVQCGTRQLGRGGIGAIMGAKNLKAVAVYGEKSIPIANEDLLKELVKEQVKQLAAAHGTKRMQRYGTAAIHALINQIGDYPYKNFRETFYPDHEKLNGEGKVKRTIRNAGCPNCMIMCWKFTYVREGPYAGAWVDGPEYETFCTFGGLLDIPNLDAVIYANMLADNYGIDTISAGVSIAFAIEAFERGILTTKDTDGMELKWGDEKVLMELIRKISFREGIGDLLAEGVKIASERIGKGSEEFAIHIKGLELPAYDPRPVKAHGLNMVTSNIGGSHALGYGTQEVFGLPTKVDRFSLEGKGALAAYNQNRLTWGECCIWCTFPTRSEWHKPDLLTKIVNAATGIDFGGFEEAVKIGERVWNVEKAFNVREGFDRRHDTLPTRFLKEPIPSGPSAGQIFELEPLLNQYYEARGWDVKTGLPTRAKLEELGLKDIADELEKLGKLPY
ncbi:MAG: aldehyde ferredoxin oxidoreductase family protein [Candidatus Methanomethylicaceae archaeon]